MRYQTARNLTTLDINSMTLEQVQRHRVRLRMPGVKAEPNTVLLKLSRMVFTGLL